LFSPPLSADKRLPELAEASARSTPGVSMFAD